MSQAEALLDSMTDEEISAYLADAETEEHIIIGSDRFIKVPAALRRIAVQHDHNVETVTFDCPRYWDGLDMSKMAIYINYILANGYKDSCPADNIVVDENDETIMHFTWTISKNVTRVKGTVTFLVCVKNADTYGNEENHWNSELNKEMTVSEGLECEESPVITNPDLVTHLLLRTSRAEETVNTFDERLTKEQNDIETALDSILAIQNTLIGGETA